MWVNKNRQQRRIFYVLMLLYIPNPPFFCPPTGQIYIKYEVSSFEKKKVFEVNTGFEQWTGAVRQLWNSPRIEMRANRMGLIWAQPSVFAEKNKIAYFVRLILECDCVFRSAVTVWGIAIVREVRAELTHTKEWAILCFHESVFTPKKVSFSSQCKNI